MAIHTGRFLRPCSALWGISKVCGCAARWQLSADRIGVSNLAYQPPVISPRLKRMVLVKIKLRDPVREAFRRLQGIDLATGVRRRHESLAALKKRCQLERVIPQVLEQAGEDRGTRLMFHCFRPRHHTNGDENPSLWVDVEKQRWGCVCGMFSADEPQSGDVIDFIRKVHHMTFKEADEWLRIWDYHHNQIPSDGGGRIRVRLPASRKRRA